MAGMLLMKKVQLKNIVEVVRTREESIMNPDFSPFYPVATLRRGHRQRREAEQGREKGNLFYLTFFIFSFIL